eukprot:gene16525-22557_t
MLNNIEARGSVRGGSVQSLDRRSNISRNNQTTAQTAFLNQDKHLEKKLNLVTYSERGSTKSSAKRVVSTNSNELEHESVVIKYHFYHYILSNKNIWYSRWNKLLLLLALISVFLIPYQLAFALENGRYEVSNYSKNSALILSLILDIVFVVHLLIHSFHIMSPELIETMCIPLQQRIIYKDGYFVPTAPSITITAASVSTNQNKLSTHNTPLISQKSNNYLSISNSNNSNNNINNLQLASPFLISLLNAHWFGCVFYFVAVSEKNSKYSWLDQVKDTKPEGLPNEAGKRYLLSLYWSMITMSTTGYGDISPQQPEEYIVVIVFLIFNLFLSAWILGNMTLLVTQSDESTRIFRDKFKNLEAFMNQSLLPEEIKDSMRSYLILQFNIKKEHREVMNEFPSVFQSKVNRFLFKPSIDASFFSEIGSDAFIDSLACALTLEILMPYTDAVSQYDASSEMFILVSGCVDLLIEDNDYYDQQNQDENDLLYDDNENDLDLDGEYQ